MHPLICYRSTNIFFYFLKIKHHSKLKTVSNQSLGKDMGEQHWVISDSAQCIEMILTGLYADLLSTWYCVLLDVHCSYDTFNVFLLNVFIACLGSQSFFIYDVDDLDMTCLRSLMIKNWECDTILNSVSKI